MVDPTSSSLNKLSLASADEQNKILNSSNVTVQRKSLAMADVMDNETVLRSPVGKRHTYDDEVNESLRILKERKTGTSLASVPDESNCQSSIDQDREQESSSNHSSVPSMPQTKVNRKRRIEIVPQLITPVKSMCSDTNLSPTHPNKSDSQNAIDTEHAYTSNHPIKQPNFQNVVIRKSRKSEKNSHFLAPVQSMRSNTILVRSPTNMDVIQDKTKQPSRSHSCDEVVHKRCSRSSDTLEPRDDTDTHADKHPIRGGRISNQSDREQTPITGRSRRSQTPVDYTKFFLSEERQK